MHPPEKVRKCHEGSQRLAENTRLLRYERLYFVPYEKICSKTVACTLFRSFVRRSFAAIFPLTRKCFFKPFQKICPPGKCFEMLSWGGLVGRSPTRNLRYACLAPGGFWGASPPRNLRYPCLAPLAAVTCPHIHTVPFPYTCLPQKFRQNETQFPLRR